jgi:hypothetical protein
VEEGWQTTKCCWKREGYGQTKRIFAVPTHWLTTGRHHEKIQNVCIILMEIWCENVYEEEYG